MRQLLLVLNLITTAFICGDDRLLRVCRQAAPVLHPARQLADDDERESVTDGKSGTSDEAARKRTKFLRPRLATDQLLLHESPVAAAAVVRSQAGRPRLLTSARPLFTWFCLLLI